MRTERSTTGRTAGRVARPVAPLVVLVALLGLVGCGGGLAGARTPSASAPAPGPPASPDETTIVAEGGALPDGVYRVEFTEEHLADLGHDAFSIANNAGVWTHTLDGGRYTVDVVTSQETDRLVGVYQVAGDDLYWRFHDTLDVLHVTWSTDERGDLHFTQVTDTGPHADFQFALPWVLVT